eukprot:scaffold406086_cov51-Prasinocladus_malaysianus.AAC.4
MSSITAPNISFRASAHHYGLLTAQAKLCTQQAEWARHPAVPQVAQESGHGQRALVLEAVPGADWAAGQPLGVESQQMGVLPEEAQPLKKICSPLSLAFWLWTLLFLILRQLIHQVHIDLASHSIDYELHVFAFRDWVNIHRDSFAELDNHRSIMPRIV